VLLAFDSEGAVAASDNLKTLFCRSAAEATVALSTS
jgi:hypothetical protein